ncbi:MAG: 2-C-methyl-D-erythritol 4-phosphate cytidylyltransferase [Actinomycetota bacterium]|nr:2-C-methyl-D-erythritol 4-phosphate cytidylyltransferase [Actinomycetota bacterium]
MSVCGIVLAAGRGLRFGGLKQFAELDGRLLVHRSVDVAAAVCHDVIVVLPPGARWNGRTVTSVVQGGRTRAQSVRHGLRALPPGVDIVAVHDAAHPLATAPLLHSVVRAVADGAAAAVPGLRPTEVIKRVEGDLAGMTVGRDDLVAVQMPQAYRADVLLTAHDSAGRTAPGRGPEILEDSALVEAAGQRVRVVPGEATNIHVTSPRELTIARCIARHLR